MQKAILCLVFAILCLPPAARPQRADKPSSDTKGASADALVGLWGVEQSFGSAVNGELTVDVHGSEWRARIAGFTVPVKHDAGAISFNLPGGAGEFRGHLSADSKAIFGDWVQPPVVTGDNRYATPVHLSALHPAEWRGQVTPADDRISFYISIQRSTDGLLTAFIRNPEFNFFRRRVYRVELQGAKVTLTNTKRADDQIVGTYDREAGGLTLPVLDGHPALLLTRRKNADAAGFFPRTPSGLYLYRKPAATNDGWATAGLADVSLDPRPISALIEKILGADLADNPLDVHSLLIARHGKLVLEEYFYGFDQERPHDMRSAGKTFGPALAGIARDHGVKIGPATPVYALFPEYKPFANWDERKNRLTLQNLMTMTSGLACDDNDDASPGNEDVMQEQKNQKDWFKYTLDLPVARDPGGKDAIYCSAGMNLVGAVVKNSAGKWLPELFDEYLARPLQFHTYHMNLTPTGEGYMGGGIQVRPRDEIKLGQLYLSAGIWNGRRVVTKEWVEESTTPHSTFAPQMDFELNHQYGYGWHLNDLKVDGHVYHSYSAGGNGGQLVIVVPELDLVIGFNGGSYGEFTKWYRWGLQIVPQYIIPAALGH